MDEPAFLAALAANPGDDLLRTAFADWLDDHNDPRAGWVRDAEIWRHAGPSFRDPIPGLVGELGAPQRRKRITPALVPFGSMAVPAILAALRTDNQAVRHHAREVLQEMGAVVADHLPEILRLLRSENRLERLAAVEAVVALGPRAAAAVPLLGELLVEPDGAMMLAAVEAVARLGPCAAPLIPALRMANEQAYEVAGDDVGDGIRRESLRALKEMGQAAIGGLDLLLDGLRYGDEATDLAVDALRRLGQAVAEDVLRAAVDLDSEDEDAAIELLVRYGAEVVPCSWRRSTTRRPRVTFASLPSGCSPGRGSRKSSATSWPVQTGRRSSIG